MTDLDKFKEFFAQFGITLSNGFANRFANHFTPEGDKVHISHCDVEFIFTPDGKFVQLDISD